MVFVIRGVDEALWPTGWVKTAPLRPSGGFAQKTRNFDILFVQPGFLPKNGIEREQAEKAGGKGSEKSDGRSLGSINWR